MKTPIVGTGTPIVSSAPETPISAQEKPAEKARTVVFQIPAGVPVTVHGKPVVSGNATTPASAVVTGAPLAVPRMAIGIPIPPEAIAALRQAFVKVDGKYVISEEQMVAAKRALLTFWGFPKDFVQEHGDKLELSKVLDTESAIDENGRVSGTLGYEALEGWINSNVDWDAASIATVMRGVAVPATSLELSNGFFERNDIAEADRAAVTDRMFAALSNWKNIDDGELAWAKGLIGKGFDLEGPFGLTTLRGYPGVLDSRQSISGKLETKDGVRQFSVSVSKGIVAIAPTGWHLQLGLPST